MRGYLLRGQLSLGQATSVSHLHVPSESVGGAELCVGAAPSLSCARQGDVCAPWVSGLFCLCLKFKVIKWCFSYQCLLLLFSAVE